MGQRVTRLAQALSLLYSTVFISHLCINDFCRCEFIVPQLSYNRHGTAFRHSALDVTRH